MRKTMISLCTVLALLCCLLGSAAAAELSQPAQSASAPAAAAPEQPAAAKAAVQPQRIALLTVGRLDMDEQANLQAELQQRFYVPLNGVLGAVEFVPAADCAQALAASGCREEKDLYAQLPQLAQAMKADLVVVLSVGNYDYSTYYNFWQDELYTRIDVSLRIIGYDRAANMRVERHASRFYNDTYTSAVTLESLARDTLDEVLRGTVQRDKGRFSLLAH